MQLNENICQCREAKGYSQEYMGEKLSMSQSTYSRREKYGIIDDTLLGKIASILSTTPDAIHYYHLPTMPTVAQQTGAMFQQKDEVIALLKEQMNHMREENSRLHARLADYLLGGGK